MHTFNQNIKLHLHCLFLIQKYLELYLRAPHALQTLLKKNYSHISTFPSVSFLKGNKGLNNL